jgi:hypothetical protein
MGIRRALIAALAAAALLAGCGGGGGGGTSDAVDLTKWLPDDATSYRVADVSGIKEDLGLPEDANPVDPLKDETQDAALQIIGIFIPPVSATIPAGTKPPEVPRFRDMPLLNAIDPAAVTAAASAILGPGPDIPRTVVLETTADTGEVGSALGDLGYTDDGGILVPPDDIKDAPTVRLDDGLIFASTEPDALRSIPDDPADELPLRILDEVDGRQIVATRTDADCVVESAIAGDREEGELAYIVDGQAEEDRFTPAGDSQVEDIDVHGDLLVAHVELRGDQQSINDFVSVNLPGYDC